MKCHDLFSVKEKKKKKKKKRRMSFATNFAWRFQCNSVFTVTFEEDLLCINITFQIHNC